MTPEEAAELMYQKWLVMPLSGPEKRAIRVLCEALGLPDPKIQRKKEEA